MVPAELLGADRARRKVAHAHDALHVSGLPEMAVRERQQERIAAQREQRRGVTDGIVGDVGAMRRAPVLALVVVSESLQAEDAREPQRSDEAVEVVLQASEPLGLEEAFEA